MKSLDNYISERLNPGHLGPTDVFPMGGTVDSVINFLNRHGFEKVEFNKKNPNYHDASNELSKYKGKGFVVLGSNFYGGPTMKTIMFADTSQNKVSDSKPAYVISWHVRDETKPYFYGMSMKSAGLKFIDEDEFEAAVKELFKI